MTRAMPDHIDAIIEETLLEYPDCHHTLGQPIDVEEQIQEDIVPAHICKLFDFTTTAYKNKNLQRLSKRFVQLWQDMFRFLKDPSLDWNNNRAERMIRPNVIYRNRSYGKRSDRGAEAHGTLM